MNRILLVAVVALSGCASPVQDALRPPVTKQELSGTWVGHDSSGVEFYSLVLSNLSSALLVTVYNAEPDSVKVFRASHWDVRDFKISLQFTTVPNERGPIVAHGNTMGADITLLIKGEGWEHTVRFIREETLKRELSLADGAVMRGSGVSGTREPNSPVKSSEK